MHASLGEETAALSFGEALRRERELRRIPLRDVSEATKINIRYLEALERNEFTYLPAGAFTRGFIRSFARYIGTDESEMINAYLYEVNRQEKQTKGQPRDGQHALLHSVPARRDSSRTRALTVLVVVLALLVVGAAIGIPVLLRQHHAPAAPPATTQAP